MTHEKVFMVKAYVFTSLPWFRPRTSVYFMVFIPACALTCSFIPLFQFSKSFFRSNDLFILSFFVHSLILPWPFIINLFCFRSLRHFLTQFG